MITLSLPFPPSVNVMYRRGKFSTYLSKQGRAYKVVVAEIVAQAGVGSIDDRLQVSIALSSPSKRQYDIDNRIKGCLDALQDAGVFNDDEQIDELNVVRHEPSKGGYCKVVIVQKEKPPEGG